MRSLTTANLARATIPATQPRVISTDRGLSLEITTSATRTEQQCEPEHSQSTIHQQHVIVRRRPATVDVRWYASALAEALLGWLCAWFGLWTWAMQPLGYQNMTRSGIPGMGMDGGYGMMSPIGTPRNTMSTNPMFTSRSVHSEDSNMFVPPMMPAAMGGGNLILLPTIGLPLLTCLGTKYKKSKSRKFRYVEYRTTQLIM